MIPSVQESARPAPLARSSSAIFALSDAAFACLLALLSTALAYRFGVGNQIEQLPMILRQLDPGYLVDDVFVSSSASFGPRFYFARIVAMTCQWMSLSWAYAVLRLVSDLALVAVTMWTARRVIGTDRLGAMMAAVLTVVVSAIHLGDATELRYAVFQPASLSIPGMLLALAFGLLGRPIAVAVVAAVVSFPHPLYGTYGAVIGLATAFVALLVANWHRGAGTASRIALLRTAIGAVLFSVTLFWFWWRPTQAVNSNPLSGDELFAILAYFRSPHHYLPSHFRAEDYVTLALFLWVLWLVFERWRRAVPREAAAVLVVPILISGAGCAAGAVFTDVWPLGPVLTLQPFRLLAVLKWFGFLLLAWVLADHWQRRSTDLARPAVAVSLLSAGGAHSLVTAAALTLVRFRELLPTAIPTRVWSAALAILAVSASFAFGMLDERVRLFAAVLLLAAFAARSRWAHAIAGVATVLMVLGIAANRPRGSADGEGPLQPVFSFDDLRTPQAEAARAAARYSPADARFVAPPHFGILRLVGRRAMVVDFEALPFQPDEMRAWRARIRDVYGDVGGGGHEARAALDRNYRQISDAHLRSLAERYHATHAVLYADTASALPVLYSDDEYRIVSLERIR